MAPTQRDAWEPFSSAITVLSSTGLASTTGSLTKGQVKLFWAIAVGAATGGVSRYYLGSWIQQKTGIDFPSGTFFINVSGSLLIGLLLRYALTSQAWSIELRALLTTGFCGGYTTFSTYSYETATLLENGEYRRAFLYAIGSMLTALFFTFAGFLLARKLIKWHV